jgi:hypothetical protein
VYISFIGLVFLTVTDSAHGCPSNGTTKPGSVFVTKQPASSMVQYIITTANNNLLHRERLVVMEPGDL